MGSRLPTKLRKVVVLAVMTSTSEGVPKPFSVEFPEFIDQRRQAYPIGWF